MFRVKYYLKTVLLIFPLLPIHFVFAETTENNKDTATEHFNLYVMKKIMRI